eukprot:scaffold421259_cov45-Attheya_sp.AAC.5
MSIRKKYRKKAHIIIPSCAKQGTSLLLDDQNPVIGLRTVAIKTPVPTAAPVENAVLMATVLSPVQIAQFEDSGDYEVAIKKLETEAEERMAEKIAEMEKTLETTGQAN